MFVYNWSLILQMSCCEICSPDVENYDSLQMVRHISMRNEWGEIGPGFIPLLSP